MGLRVQSLKKMPAARLRRACLCVRQRGHQIPEVLTAMRIQGGQGGVWFTQSDPSRFRGDSLFLGFRGGAASCSLSRVLFLLALGVPPVPGHQSHIPQVVDVEAVGLFVPRTHLTAEGRVSPEVTLGATQVTDVGCFLECGEKRKQRWGGRGWSKARHGDLGAPNRPPFSSYCSLPGPQRGCKAALHS